MEWKVLVSLAIFPPLLLMILLHLMHQRGQVRHEQVLVARLGNGKNEEFFHGDELIPGLLYIGPYYSSLQFNELKTRNITHIISVLREVFVPPISFPQQTIKDFSYLVIKANDNHNQNLLDYFEIVHSFIEEAKSNGTAVLIHCMAGVSRSATLSISYLMKYHNWDANTAIIFAKKARSVISPNPGFRKQLLLFENMQKAKQQGKLHNITDIEPKFYELYPRHSTIKLQRKNETSKYLKGNAITDFMEGQTDYLWQIYERYF